ncbi:MAG: hypothetical protein A2V70_09220 [Planctomycetes bacterium RBG_13_63_9]|nr:MAG: hypothetical protein A2V70_09220 [Planctomycetes bacterium RBG_13_63_9]
MHVLANEGLKLLKPADKRLSAGDIPGDWRGHLPVVRGQRATQRIIGVPEDADDRFDELVSGRRRVPFNADFRGAKFDDNFRVQRPGFLGVFSISAVNLSSNFWRRRAPSAFSTSRAGGVSGSRFAGVSEEFGLGQESADVSYWRPRKGENG